MVNLKMLGGARSLSSLEGAVVTWPWTSGLQNQLMAMKYVWQPFQDTLLSSFYDIDSKTRGSTVAFIGSRQLALAAWSNAQVERSGKPGTHVSDMADNHKHTWVGSIACVWSTEVAVGNRICQHTSYRDPRHAVQTTQQLPVTAPPPPCVCVCVCMCPGTYMPQYTWIRMWSVITFYLLWDGILCICLASWTGKFRESPRLHPPSFISSGMKVFTTISGFTWFLGLWTQFIILALLCADRKGWCFCICLSKVR